MCDWFRIRKDDYSPYCVGVGSPTLVATATPHPRSPREMALSGRLRILRSIIALFPSTMSRLTEKMNYFLMCQPRNIQAVKFALDYFSINFFLKKKPIFRYGK